MLRKCLWNSVWECCKGRQGTKGLCRPILQHCCWKADAGSSSRSLPIPIPLPLPGAQVRSRPQGILHYTHFLENLSLQAAPEHT